MSRPPNYMRLLAVFPTRRGFGYAVREGPRLVDWGVANVCAVTDERFRARIEVYLERYSPSTIVVEAGMSLKRNGRGSRRVDAVVELAAQKNIRVVRVTRDDVRRALNLPSGTRATLIRALATRFPDLWPHIPPPKKPWKSEDIRMNMFDAIGMVVGATGHF